MKLYPGKYIDTIHGQRVILLNRTARKSNRWWVVVVRGKPLCRKLVMPQKHFKGFIRPLTEPV